MAMSRELVSKSHRVPRMHLALSFRGTLNMSGVPEKGTPKRTHPFGPAF